MHAIIENLPYMLGGLPYTFGLAVIGIFFSFFAGALLAILRLSKIKWLHYPAVVYIEVTRSIPLILFIFFVYFMIAGMGYNVSAFSAAAIATVVFYSTYIAEIVRAGIQSVDGGQMEAARATGLSYVRAMKKVVLPQAIRRMVPALVSEFTIIIKESSLAMVIGVPEFFNRVFITNARVLTEPLALLGFAALIYFIICYVLSLLSRRLELRVDQ